MSIGEDANAGAGELTFQLALRAVDDDQVWTQREDPFRVGVEQGADARQRLGLRREVVVGADADDLRSRADGEEHLGHVWDERHNPAGRRDLCRGRPDKVRPPEQSYGKNSEGQLRRTSSHKKNGPPSIAVTTPTGTSTGASTVRATRSQPTRNAAPNSADAGSTSR